MSKTKDFKYNHSRNGSIWLLALLCLFSAGARADVMRYTNDSHGWLIFSTPLEAAEDAAAATVPGYSVTTEVSRNYGARLIVWGTTKGPNWSVNVRVLCQRADASTYSANLINGNSWTCDCTTYQGWDQVSGTCGPAPQNQGAKSCPLLVGNPINAGWGNKYQSEVDYVGAAGLTLTRSYNSKRSLPQSASLIPAMIASPPFGANWRGSFERAVVFYYAYGYRATLYRPDGSAQDYYKSGLDYLPAVLTDKSSLKKVGSAWQYVDAITDAKENYNTSGVLLSITTRNGITQSLTYSDGTTGANGGYILDAAGNSTGVTLPAGLLIRVSDSFGRTLTFGYDSSKRIVLMRDPEAAEYHYQYDANRNLLSVTYPPTPSDVSGATRQYVYNETAHSAGNYPNALTGIVDENASRFATFTYDAAALATSSEHAGGVESVSLTYNSDGTTTVTDALGQARNYGFQTITGTIKNTGISAPCSNGCNAASAIAYDANGNPSSRTDFNGNQTTYAHNLTRNLETSRTEAYGTPRARTITTQWHATYHLPTQIDEPGRRTAYTHDANGNVLTHTVTDLNASPNLSRTWTYTYNSFGQVLTANGPRTDLNDITTYTYYNCATGSECGQVQTITNAVGHVTTYNTYNAHGQPLTITDPNGVVTTLTYDLRQRLTSRTVGAEQTTFDYWPTGLLKKATLPDGSYLNYTYDAAHRVTGIADSEGNRIAYTLDAMGNRTAENAFDPSNTLIQTRERVFNTLNQLWKEIGAAGTPSVTTEFGYDNNGNQNSINAPLARSTEQTYDELNRLIQITDPGTGLTKYGYNALDQLISVTDPRNKVTSYTYNALGDLTEQVSPDTGTTIHTYDSAGNLKTKTEARNRTGTYSYDALNRVTQLVYPDQTIAYTYDQGANALGRLTGISDASGSTAWGYDPHGRVTSRQQTIGSLSLSTGYSYNTVGQLQSLTLPSGNAITYGYANGKITSLTLNGSTTLLSNVLYQPFGPTLGWTWGNATLAIREYDTDGKVTDIDSAGLKGYAYDDAFRITSITDVDDPNLSQSYGYDLLDRLTSASGTGLNQSWSYDANGNRLTQGGSQASTYTIATTSNRISSIGGSLTRTYGYDAAGNTSSDGTATFTYDDAGRMVSVTKSSVTTTYKLNALGQRVRKTTGGMSTYFAYDEAGHLIGEYDNSGNLIEETIWFEDIPVAVLKPNGGGGINFFYIHTDHLNTPRRISRQSDNVVVWRWDSDPFGTTTANEDPEGDSNLFVYNLRFPGQYFDQETGLHYNYYRDGYDPAVGRYTQSDPIGLDGGINTYVYADADPISLADPLGLEPGGGPRNPRHGVSLSCKWSDTCKQIEGKMTELLRIIASHTGWDRQMPRPRGGNRHAKEIADFWRAYGNCQRIHNAKCKQNCPPPQSDPMTEIGIGALMLGGAACIAFPEVCIPGLILGGAAAGASQ